jgi:hypothetical protein
MRYLPVAITAISLIVAGACVWELRRQRERADQAAATAEAADLRAHDVVVGAAGNVAKLAADLSVRDSALAAELERVRRLAPEVKVTTVERLQTRYVYAMLAAADAGGVVLRSTDQLKLTLADVHLRTVQGNTIVAATLQVYRLRDGVVTQLVDEPADASVSSLTVGETAAEKRWSAGPLVGLGLTGPVAGLVVSSRYGERLSLTGVALGGSGYGAVLGGVTFSW